MRTILARRTSWILLLVLTGIGGIAFWQRHSALAWFHVRQLSTASKDDCEEHAKGVASLREAALPHVISRLRDRDEGVCGNMQRALFLIFTDWGAADTRTQLAVDQLQARFEEFSPAGREKILLLLTALLQQDSPKPLPPRLTKSVSEILVAAEKVNDLRGPSLLLAAELVDCVQPGQWVDVCRSMAERGMKDEAPAARAAALHLLLREPMRADKGLISLALSLLDDKAAPVRRAALLALAAETDVAREEHFLPLLHDDDPEVQDLCQITLRKRGLNDGDLLAARMVGDKNPATRTRVLNLLPQMPELNLGEWLKRLSQDPSAQVRAAAVRAAGDYLQVDMSQRLREMAEGDPSETVRLNARYYLEQRTLRTASDRR